MWCDSTVAATKADIRRWFAQGRLLGWTHLIVVCDTFDHNDYPMYASSADEARNLFADTSEMKTPMEVYNLALPAEAQLN